MISPRGILAVVRFMGRRAITGSQLVWWVLLALFPGAVALLINLTTEVPFRSNSGTALPTEGWLLLLYALLPCVICVAGTFLWVTATVQSEIDAKTWVYLASRPYGVTSLLVGNYVVGVLWTISVALAALAIVLPITRSAETMRTWPVFVKLILLAAPAYASVYTLIGVLFIKRAMFVAVVYTLIFEVVLGLLPAIVNKLTIQFRLRSLAYHWFEINAKPAFGEDLREVFSDAPPYQHVVVLIAIAVMLLAAAVVFVATKETTLGAEGDF